MVVAIEDVIRNVQNEILFVGSLYKKPDLIVEYGHYIREKYDFSDPISKFFYECAVILYERRTQEFSKSIIMSFMTEDTDRLATYKQAGGWKTLDAWMHLTNVNDIKNYFEVLKKYSLLREYSRQGFDCSKIIAHKKFELFTAADIYKLIRSKADKIKTVILEDSETEILNSRTEETILDCLEQPDEGIPYPFHEWTEMFRGARLGTMLLLGMLSNGGKSRILCKLVAYIALIQKQNVLVLLNEMSIREFRFALITTVVNNPEFEELHGIHLTKKEREITLGKYRDSEGNIIQRHTNAEGIYTESMNDYMERLSSTSEEFNKIRAITRWIDEESAGKIVVKDIQSDYSEDTVQFEIRKAAMTEGIKFCAYDTLKPEKSSIGAWDDFKRMATLLSELSKELKINLTATFQLTDAAAHIDPMDFTSNEISSSKQIIQVADSMVAFAEVHKDSFHKYAYIVPKGDWGEAHQKDLDTSKRYYICNTLKNRAGNKLKLLFSLNLDLNIWKCEGEVVRKSRR